MSTRAVVSAGEFVGNAGYWMSEALRRPVSITHHGRERLVLAQPNAAEIIALAKSYTVEARFTDGRAPMARTVHSERDALRIAGEWLRDGATVLIVEAAA